MSFSGTTTDDFGVDRVRASIRDRSSGQWLRADGSFGNFYLHEATVANPGALASSWGLSLNLPDGLYAMTVRSIDAAGVEETTKARVKFRVGSIDTVEPNTTLLTPTEGSTAVGPVTFSGTTTDNVGVDRVLVAVRDRDTGQWLRADGSMGNFQLIGATVDNPGLTLSTWSLDVNLAPGRYAATARSEDSSGLRESDKPRVKFEVSDANNTEANSTITAPTVNEALGESVDVFGSATDDSGVDEVRIIVRDRDSSLWLQGDGSFATGVFFHQASLATPGATATDWSFSTSLPAGSYFLSARAVDDAGVVESTRPRVNFTVALTDPPPADPITFRVIADTPYTPEAQAALFAEMPNLNADEEFVAHLGDIKKGSLNTDCSNSFYTTARDALLLAPVNAYIVLGDNEYNDCDDPALALSRWDTHLGDFEDNYSSGPTVLRQTVRPENFAFIQEGVAFIGINNVGNRQPGQADWAQIDADNAAWVAEVLTGAGASTSSAVIFSHAAQKTGIIAPLAAYDRPVLYLMGDLHVYNTSVPYPAQVPKMTRVVLGQGMPGISVTMTHDSLNPWVIDQTP